MSAVKNSLFLITGVTVILGVQALVTLGNVIIESDILKLGDGLLYSHLKVQKSPPPHNSFIEH